MLNLLNKICQTASYTTAFLFLFITHPAFADNFTQIQHQKHNIPLCGDLQKSEYKERRSTNTQRFVSVNESKTIYCVTYYTILKTVTPNRYIDDFLRTKAEEYQVSSSKMKGNRQGIIFTYEINNQNLYGGIIVIDANHLIQFNAFGKDKKKVIEAAAYMVENFR